MGRLVRHASFVVVVGLLLGFSGSVVAAEEPTKDPMQPLGLLLPMINNGDTRATPAGVAAALAQPLGNRALGSEVSAVVVADADEQVLFDTAGSTARVPASATKILTAAAVLTAFGPDHRLTTRVVRDGDSLVIVGAGDPSLRSVPSPGTTGPTIENLARRTAAALTAQGDAGPFRIVVDTSLFTGPQLASGWSRGDAQTCFVRPVVALMSAVPPGGACRPGVPPELAAAQDFADALTAAGIAVTGAPTTGVATPSTAPVAEVTSAPMAALVEEMLRDSDNVGAEMLAHLAGGQLLGDPSFAGGSAATAAALAQLGVPIAAMVLDDASGMSERNQVTMATVVSTLRAAASQEHATTLWPIVAGLPAAGFDGTLATRFTSEATDAARGEVRAKTGTLVGISALAGKVVTDNGELLTFAFVSNSTGSTLAARAALDQAATALASCGCAQ